MMTRWISTLLIAFSWQTPSFSQEESRILFSRDVAPILARHCYECHGPDSAAIEAGLQLSDPEQAMSILDSGLVAIVPGRPDESEVLRRITADDHERMPPADFGVALDPSEQAVLASWIAQGAHFDLHWSQVSPVDRNTPISSFDSLGTTPVDSFIYKQMEQASVAPLPFADRRTLIRRLYFDVIGLPPTPAQLHRFEQDSRPDAWIRLVDQVLASPHYGERWGRHWMDIARYGDSNGGDENHPLPLAWRYRDYVIRALNDDLPYDEFVAEQIAGDLINENQTGISTSRAGERLAATGFLSLGTKILAEQDPVKMQADLVDEQIDTLSKSLLAMTLSCARCHDHKFDPIPTGDYYALAGILHSTELIHHSIETPDWLATKAEFDRQEIALDESIAHLESELQSLTVDAIEIQAESFTRGNVAALDEGYGEEIGIISDPGGQDNFAEYEITIPSKEQYLIQLRYAALEARPGRILWDGDTIQPNALANTTGGWMPENQKWHSEGVYLFEEGEHCLRIESSPLMSHIDRIRLTPVQEDGEVIRLITLIDSATNDLRQLLDQEPQPIEVMGASDSQATDIAIHNRGSHLDLGTMVPRGFPRTAFTLSETSELPDESFSILDDQSGRLQLSSWLTDPEQGVGLNLARVIVNRLWHWHFAKGIVETTDNFGVQGSQPTHPALLDWLAFRLIENGWSLKSIHREILLSSTYRQQVQRHANLHYSGFMPRRLDAESLRDSLLAHGLGLDRRQFEAPIEVVAQNPSPQNLNENELAYRSSRRRSVYLPVVRSHIYGFLTAFDFPNATTSVGARDSTTVATQSLRLMNDPFVMDQSQAVAQRAIQKSPDAELNTQVAYIYEWLICRTPSARELKLLEAFAEEYADTIPMPQQKRQETLSAIAHTILVSNEYLYLD